MRYGRGGSPKGIQHILRHDQESTPWRYRRALCSSEFREEPFDPEVRVCSKCSAKRDELLATARALVAEYEETP